MSKNYLLPTNIIISLDPCPLSPIFWCFRTEFWDLLLSKPRKLPTGTFFQSRSGGESVPCRDKWSKRTGRILAEYYLRIQYIRPLGSGTTLGLHLSTSLDLRFHLFPQPMCHKQSQRNSGYPFKNGELANGHNSHKLLHLTSWNPRIHYKHISLLLFLVHPCPFSSSHRKITRQAINYFVRRWRQLYE